MKHLPLLVLSFALGACASSQPRAVSDRYTRETSTRVVSRGPVPMDDAEVGHHAASGQQTNVPLKKKMVARNGQVTELIEESVTTSTTTETVVGSQAVAAPDAEVTSH